MNKAILVGRVASDPMELKGTGDKAVTRFRLAVPKPFTKEDGTRDADFISITAWGKLAETVKKYLGKGRLVSVDGAIRTGSYDKEDGTKVYTFEVNANTIDFLDSPKKADGEAEKASDESVPF